MYFIDANLSEDLLISHHNRTTIKISPVGFEFTSPEYTEEPQRRSIDYGKTLSVKLGWWG